MSYLDEIAEIRSGYEAKFRHSKFLRRKLDKASLEKLTGDFESLWEIEHERIFPRVNEFPLGARRILHPNEKDHLGWIEVNRINDRILSIPHGMVEEEINALIPDPAASARLKEIWATVRECAEEENRFIDHHLPTMTRLVSQCPGAWLEPPTHVAFRRLCMDLPGFIDVFQKDISSFSSLARDLAVLRRYPLRVNIIGIGEITTTIELLGSPSRSLKSPESGKRVGYAVKKMPLFPTVEGAREYSALFDEYQKIIRDGIGVSVPLWGSWVKARPGGKAIVYNWQERLPQDSIAASIVVQVDEGGCRRIFRLIMGELLKIFQYNRTDPDTIMGFDGQLPNWSVVGYDAARPEIKGDEALIYIDTSTPLMRRKLASPSKGGSLYGKDLLDTEIFLKSVPAPLRPIIRITALKEVVDRYYIPRKVIMDLIASYYLYKRPDMVPVLVDDANEFMKSRMAEFELEPFTEREMAKYHKTDTMIWIFFRAVKRLDRWIKENLLGIKYEQRLPKKKFVPGPFEDS